MIGFLHIKRLVAAVLILGIPAFIIWYVFFHTTEVIKTEPVRRSNIENAISALGVLQPYRYVDVGAQVSGQVKRIALKAGDTVKKGELLLEIDPALQQATVSANRASLASLRAQLAEQEALLDFAAKQLERQELLYASEATKTEDVQNALSQLLVMQARTDNLKAQIEGAQSVLQGNEALLGYTRIYAPIDGTIVTLDAREGQTINAAYQTPNLLRIADLSRMTVWTEVSEADVGRISVGMPVYFTTLGLADKDGSPRRWHGKLSQILPAPISSSNSAAGKVVLYTALFDVQNLDGALMPQMSAQVFFVISSAKNVITVPFTALAPTKDTDVFTALVLSDGKVTERMVKTGAHDRLNAEIIEGLNENDTLVTDVYQEKITRKLRW
jgi:macrolide-specific efflux system membrane fusion protein